MTNSERHKLLRKVDKMIDVKLEALRNRIWKEAEEVPEEDLEDFINELRISAVFCHDTDVYLEVQTEIAMILNKMANNEISGSRTAHILKRLGVR